MAKMTPERMVEKLRKMYECLQNIKVKDIERLPERQRKEVMDKLKGMRKGKWGGYGEPFETDTKTGKGCGEINTNIEEKLESGIVTMFLFAFALALVGQYIVLQLV